MASDRTTLAEVRNGRGQIISLIHFADGRSGILVNGSLLARWDAADREMSVRHFMRLSNLPEPKMMQPSTGRPMPRAEAAANASSPSVIKLQPGSTVLVVDDHQDTLYAVTKMLEKGGANVIGVESGEAAMEVLQQTIPHLALIDMMMPQMSGLQLLAWMKSRPALAQVPVLLCSAGVLEAEITKGIALGATGYVQKLDETWWNLPQTLAVIETDGQQPAD